MLNLAAGDNRSESRGRRVRRLDRLLHQLREKKKNYSSKPKWVLHTGDLERLRNEARYCFIDAGLLAQAALRELNALEFTKFNVLDEESQRFHYDWIDPSSCKILDADSERQCIKNLDRVIELVDRVREMEETGGSEIGRAVAAPPAQALEKPPATIRELDTLLKLKSLSQSRAAEAFGISSRAIRDLVRHERLAKTARGRIVCDQKFVDQFNARHSPLKK
jgi:predicted XRE-type DNA-binding protein